MSLPPNLKSSLASARRGERILPRPQSYKVEGSAVNQPSIFLRMIGKINTFCGFVSGVAVICLSGVTVFETFSRKILNSPTTWSFDTSKYLFLLISFFAFTFTMRENGHISFDFLAIRAEKSRSWSLVLALVSGIFGSVFCFFLFYASLALNLMAFKYGWMTRGVTQIPAWYLYTAMCAGSLLLLITFLIKTVSSIWRFRRNSNLG